MPSTSGRQHRLMEAIAHGAKPKDGHGPSPAVAKEFVEADKAAGKHFAGSKNKKSAHESHMHGGFHGK